MGVRGVHSLCEIGGRALSWLCLALMGTKQWRDEWVVTQAKSHHQHDDHFDDTKNWSKLPDHVERDQDGKIIGPGREENRSIMKRDC